MSCLICDNSIELTGSFTCGNADCEYAARTMNLGDDYVSQYIKSKPDIVQFLLNIAYYAFNHSSEEDFQPAPIFIGEDAKSSYQLLKQSDWHLNRLWSKLSLMTNDYEIEKHYGLVIYGWIRFTLKSNLLTIDVDPTLKIHDILIIKVEHFLESQQATSDKPDTVLDNQRLFIHGSPYLNWYSIINRGLKNYSGTTKSVHGAACGKGIYLAASSQLSMSYSSASGGRQIILGVFEILDDANHYKKGGGVYVVPNNNKVRLRYLLYGPRAINCPAIDKMFSDIIVSERYSRKKVADRISNRRLLHEVKYFSQNDLTVHGIRCQFDDDNLKNWTVFLSKFDPESRLAKDLIKLKLNEIEISLEFPDEFPLKPPFVRIVRPRFEYKTGHITLGGSICMELLTNQGWNPTYSLENLIIHIKSTILEGEGQIDMKSWHHEYSYQEAIGAFKRMLLSHGWS